MLIDPLTRRGTGRYLQRLGGRFILEPEGEPGMKDKSNPPQNDIVDYAIDRRLKKGKDYPEELWLLTYQFRERGHPEKLVIPWFTKDPERKPQAYVRADRRLLTSYQKQIALAERTFKEFFLIQKPISKTIPKPFRSMTAEEMKQHKDLLIRESCIRRINARLKYLNPQLTMHPDPKAQGYKLVLIAKAERVLFGTIEPWEWLAKIIGGPNRLDTKLVHVCYYCKKIFFSKKSEKYHPGGCKSKFFSGKDTREGKAIERMKRYRKKKRTIL